MSKDQRSRALLRNLRKQARKGTLSAREKKQLLSQEEKFRKARRSTAKSVGRGLLGAGALLATPAGKQMLEGAKKSRMDRKVDKAEKRSEKETEKLEKLAIQKEREEETGAPMVEGMDLAEQAEREEFLSTERQEGTRDQEDGGKVEYGIGGAILAGVNAIRNKEGLAGIKNVVKAAATPGSGVAQGAKLAGGLLAGSKNPALAGLGKAAGLASNFLPGGGGPKGALGALGSLAGGAGGAAGAAGGAAGLLGSLAGGGGAAGGALGALGGVAGLLGGQSAEKGMKVADMRGGGRAADLKKMIAKKYGFR